MALFSEVMLSELKKSNRDFVGALHQQEIGSKWIDSSQERVFEIRLKKQCVGFVMISIIPPEANLLNIAVEKPLQNLGIGKHALGLLVAKLKRLKISMLHLEVREQSPAVRFYRREGFEATGIRKGYYTNGDNAILMTKKI